VSDRALRAGVGALALAGGVVAGYLTYHRLGGGTITCTTGGCETVQESSYATVAGVPVPILGLLGYALLFGTAWSRTDLARAAGAALALGAFVFSAYLFYVQLELIEAVCDWCLASDLIVAALVPLTLLRLWAAGRPPTP
jgi:uncharacterized membrane protein